MCRVLGVALLLIMFAGCLPIGGDAGGSGDPNLVPDSSYQPQEGDRVCLYAMDGETPIEQLPVLSDLTSYDKHERSIQGNDTQEMASLEQQGWLQYVPSGTAIFISKIHDRQHTGARVAAEVKILDGAQKGRVVWTPLANVARLKRRDPVE
jgi:hypothetical protein